MHQSEHEADERSRQKAREKAVEQGGLVLVLSLIGCEKGVSVSPEAYYCKTKDITLVSCNAHGNSDEPIRKRSKCM